MSPALQGAVVCIPQGVEHHALSVLSPYWMEGGSVELLWVLPHEELQPGGEEHLLYSCKHHKQQK